MHKNIGKSVSKKLSSKYSQTRFDQAKQSATGAPKTSSIVQKTAEPTGDLINNKVAVAVASSCGDGDKITIRWIKRQQTTEELRLL